MQDSHNAGKLTFELGRIYECGWGRLNEQPGEFMLLLSAMDEIVQHFDGPVDTIELVQILVRHILDMIPSKLSRTASKLLGLESEYAEMSIELRLQGAYEHEDWPLPRVLIEEAEPHLIWREIGLLVYPPEAAKVDPEPTAHQEEFGLAYAHAFFLSADHKPYERVVEEVEPKIGSMGSRITVTKLLPTRERVLSRMGSILDLENRAWATPDDLPAQMVLPIAIFRRGIYLDHFSVSDENGKNLSVVPRRGSQQLSSAVLKMSWRMAFKDAPDNPELTKLRNKLLSIPHMDPTTAVKTRREVLRELFETNAPVRSYAEVFRLFRRAALLSKRYVMWAEVTASPGQRVTLNLSFERRFVLNRLLNPLSSPENTDAPALKLTMSAYAKAKRTQFRAWIGLKVHKFAVRRIPTARPPVPVQMFFDCGLMKLAGSYHFKIQAPDGFYVSRQDFLLGNPSGAADGKLRKLQFIRLVQHSRDVDGWPADYSGHGAAGAPYGHLYVEGLPTPEPVLPVQAAVSFYEIPPGSASTMLTLSVGLLLNGLILLFAPLVPHTVGDYGITFDLASLLLAAPAGLLVLRSIRQGDRTSFLAPPIPVLFVQRIAMAFVIVTLFGALLEVLSHRIAALVPTDWVTTPAQRNRVDHDFSNFLTIARLLAELVMLGATLYLRSRRLQALKDYNDLQQSVVGTPSTLSLAVLTDTSKERNLQADVNVAKGGGDDERTT